MIARIYLFLLLICASPVMAADVLSAATVARTVVALLFILALLAALPWLIKRSQRWQVAGPSRLRVVAATGLGAKERAVLIAVDGRELLLGVSPGGVTMLAEISPASDSPEPKA